MSVLSIVFLLVSGVPDFALHAQLSMPPVSADPFWPGLGFPHMFAGLHPSPSSLGLPWPHQDAKTPPQFPVPSFHALLSQYMLAGGANLPVPPGFPGIPGFTPFSHLPGQSNLASNPAPSRSISPDDARDSSKSPTARSDDGSRSPPMDSGEESRKNSIEALRIRAQEHLMMSGGQHLLLPKPKLQT